MINSISCDAPEKIEIRIGEHVSVAKQSKLIGQNYVNYLIYIFKKMIVLNFFFKKRKILCAKNDVESLIYSEIPVEKIKKNIL